jgi:DNA polymerase III epsilon subunit-like protein
VLAAVPCCVVDLETTGLDPQTDRIIELAVVRLNAADSLEWEFSSLVAGDKDGAEEIHGISSQSRVGAPPFAVLMPLLSVAWRGAVLVAHNVAFDVAFLAAAFAREGQQLALETLACTRELAEQDRPVHASRSLCATCARHGIDHAYPHRALHDARATAQLYLRLREGAADRRHRVASPRHVR